MEWGILVQGLENNSRKTVPGGSCRILVDERSVLLLPIIGCNYFFSHLIQIFDVFGVRQDNQGCTFINQMYPIGTVPVPFTPGVPRIKY